MPLPSNLTAWTKQLVKHYNLRPKLNLGQHFLVDKKVLQQIVAAAELAPAAPVLEVGGGFGVLTLALLEQAARVTVVELDKTLARALQKIAATTSSLNVLSGDILKISDSVLRRELNLGGREDFWLVANLPYDISGKFLRRFLAGPLRPRLMVLLLQSEVADRLLARANNVSLLTLQAWLAASIKIVRRVSRRSFWPQPKVDSAIVKFRLYNQSEREKLLAGTREDWLWRLARAGFSARRKFLLSNLNRQLKLDKPKLIEVFNKINLSSSVRAQELGLAQWIELAGELDNNLKLKKSTKS